MRTADRKLVERNLDLIFEFEKYVLEHPEITEKIPRDAVVFMKVAGDQKFNRWSERQAKRQAKPWNAPGLDHGEKNGTRPFAHRRARTRVCRLVGLQEDWCHSKAKPLAEAS